MPYFETIDQRLPLGFHVNNTWFNTAVVREWIASDSQILNAAETRNNRTKAITAFLAATILEFKNSDSGETFTKITKDVIRDMYIGDRDMCLLAGRKLTYGNELEITFKCQNTECREDNVFDFNLDNIDTKFSEEFPPALEHHVELEKGIRTANETFKAVILQPLRGREQEQINPIVKTNPSKAASHTIYCAIKNIPGMDMSMKNTRIVDELRAKDLNTLLRAFQEMHIGPNLSADVLCANCEAHYEFPLGEMILSVLG